MTCFFFQEPGLAQVLFEGSNDLLYNLILKYIVFSGYTLPSHQIRTVKSHTFCLSPCRLKELSHVMDLAFDDRHGLL
jgi:hypothetical protein